jgi:NADPH:quinone reductase-like Zn-dependent oxidoreductase
MHCSRTVPLLGKVVLVAGGAGAVGHFAIQLARRAGRGCSPPSARLPRPVRLPAVPIRRLLSRNLTLRFLLLSTVPAAALRAAVEEVNAPVTAGSLTELPVIRYGLDQIAEAHQVVEDGATGKVMVDL